jgi:hypothetical protein
VVIVPDFEQMNIEIPQVDIPDEFAPSRRPEVEITTPHTAPSPGPGADFSSAEARIDTFMNPIGFNFK